ncbi:hypothetical protein CVT24_012143 [Panaeolus cyanescens]|uniref:Uncharacterized protein n=1 Tax=Panaeolus cyanescens TaxID=181874 RepID=A0A409X135_9AGAR|nr:hypothetical protein CVT24_012143 [Panaeolus cyanescens]
MSVPLCEPSNATTDRITWFLQLSSAVVKASAGKNLPTALPLISAPSRPKDINYLPCSESTNGDDDLDLLEVSGDDDDDVDLHSDDGGITGSSPSATTAQVEGVAVDADWDATSSDSEATSDEEMKPTKKKTKSGDGMSKSARSSRAIRAKIKAGTYQINEAKYDTWKKKKKILADDPHAEFSTKDIRKVRHSSCGESLKVKDPYDYSRWRDHVTKRCSLLPQNLGKRKRLPKGQNAHSLFS